MCCIYRLNPPTSVVILLWYRYSDKRTYHNRPLRYPWSNRCTEARIRGLIWLVEFVGGSTGGAQAHMKRHSEALSQNPIEGPGPGIAELRAALALRSEWTSQLISAQELGQTAKNLGLGTFSEDDIVGLWHIGLLRADLVESRLQQANPGLISLEKNAQYLDLRVMLPMSDGYGGSMPKLSKEDSASSVYPFELKFHPNRVYVLHHITRTLVSNTSATQYLLWKPGVEKLARFEVDALDRWTSSAGFCSRFDYWNQLGELAAACHAVIWLPPEDKPTRSRLFPDRQCYAEMVEDYLRRSGQAMIRQCREDLAWDAHTKDGNRRIHTLLRLMRQSERDRIKGTLGAAMKFLDMAESIRRASEQLLDCELPEEDEIGPGQWMAGARKMLYGHERVFDAPRNDLRDFLGIMGLDFGVKVRCYVEGETELGAFRHAVGVDGLCSFVNLKGNVVQRNGKGVAFAESLAEDSRERVISIVVIDSDRAEVVRTLRRAASEGRMHGPFFLNYPDFEFANFNIEELLRIAIAIEKDARFDDKDVDERVVELLPSVVNTTSAKEFIRLLRANGVNDVGKGERWGEALMKYAIAHPMFPSGDARAGTERKAIEAARVLIRAQDVGYLRSVECEQVNPETGLMIKRLLA